MDRGDGKVRTRVPPQRSHGKPRTVDLHTRLTVDEYETVKLAAEIQGRTTAAWWRYYGVAEAERQIAASVDVVPRPGPTETK